jgi:hypothetical protein
MVQADTYFNAKAMVEEQYGKRNIFSGERLSRGGCRLLALSVDFGRPL